VAKVCLDSVIQHELPEASRASAFGVSETALQLSWVFGGVVGLLLGGVWTFGHDSVYTIGFAVITVLLAVGLAQSWFVRRGRSLFPWLHYAKITGRFRKSAAGKSAPGKSAPSKGSPGGPAPTTPAPGYRPPTAWSPGSTGLGQPPWSTGPKTAFGPPPAGYPPAPGPGGYPTWSPPGSPPAAAPGGPPTMAGPPTAYGPGYPPGGWTPSAAPTSDPTVPKPQPRDAGSRRKKTRDP
jgi:hypothetical protein